MAFPIDPSGENVRSVHPASPAYPEGTTRRLLATDLVTSKTRSTLAARLDSKEQHVPQVLNDAELAILRAACARLIPQDERTDPIDLASEIDRRLARGECKGWRYDAMPPDLESYQRGLHGMEESARIMFGMPFSVLEPIRQEAVLRAVQIGDVPGETWKHLPSVRFFEEMLAELAETYYSHPLAYDEIGYVGYADAHGWQNIGLNRLSPHEPPSHHPGAGSP